MPAKLSRFFFHTLFASLPASGWLLALLLLSAAARTTHAQTTAPPTCSQDEKFINNWYFGYRAGLDFNQATDSIPPRVLTDGRMVAPAGSGVMSDGTGSLLFYSNGDTVWTRSHVVMTNGTGLGGNRLATDGPLAIKMPGSPTTPGGTTRYLLFTQDAQGGPKGLSFSEIDIPMGGEGEVVAATKNTPLALGTTEKMTGVLHKNGCDVWIIVHGWGTDREGFDNRGDAFLAYRVTPAGVQRDPVISTVGRLHEPGVGGEGYRGQMKVSPDGEQLAVARYSTTLGDSTSTVELFAFDAATGRVSNPRTLDSGAGGYYGVEFSPGRSRLYATVQSAPQLLQFDLTATDVPASKQVIPLRQTTPVSLGSLQAAPDGKIYVARNNQPALGFIAYPDSLGARARYADDSLRLDGRLSGLGLPNFNQSSLLRVGFGARSTACLEITFQAGSPIPNPESYAWTFATSSGTVLGSSTLADPVFTFPAPGNYLVTLRITNFCFCRETQGLIQVPGPPTPGSIGNNQAICAGSTPAPLVSTAAAGAGTGQFSYKWQRSTDNSSWVLIPGATGETYAPTASDVTTTTYFRRLVTSGFCAPDTPTASVVITVTPALTAGSIGADQTLCAGATLPTLVSTAGASGGTGTYAYQWQFLNASSVWENIPGATNATFTPTTLLATTSYRRQVTSGPCVAESNTVTLTLAPALTAGTIGTNQTICVGTAAQALTSDILASGGLGNITYRWQRLENDGTWRDLDGATSPTYEPGQLLATTSFRRQASNSCGPVVSNVVTITVTPALTAGSIADNQTLCAGTTPLPFISTAGASGGTGTYSYQWYTLPSGSSTWVIIPGATGETYAPPAPAVTTSYRRQVTSGGCGPVNSPSVTLTVLPALTAGTISRDQTICAGSVPEQLTSTGGPTGGTGTYTYAWDSSLNGSDWQPTGATGESFTPPALAATTFYRRRVTSGSCTTTPSNTVKIEVAPALTAGTIGANQTLCAGNTAIPLAGITPASGGTGLLTYQWQSTRDITNEASWRDEPGARGDTFAPGAPDVTTYYRRQVSSGACGPVVSNVVTITVTPALTAGTIGTDQTLCPGATPAPLTSTAGASGGTGTYAYQWQFLDTSSTWVSIPGATGETYAPPAPTVTTSYRRQVTSGGCGPVNSPSVTLTVLPVLTAGTIGTDQTICANATPAPLTSTAGASGGTGTYAYQWDSSPDGSSGWQPIGGATGESFAPPALTTTTYYRRRVVSGTGTCATGVSNVVAVRVTPLLTPTVTLAAPPVQCPGTALTFTATVTNVGTAPTFRWLVNNVAVASGPTFTSSTLITGDQVRVEVTPTVGLCTTGLATAAVTVTRTVVPQPTLAIAGQPNGPVCLGDALTFSIASVTNAGAAPTYQWQVNGTDVTGATAPVFTSTTLRDGQTVTLRLRTIDACGQPATVVSNGVVVKIQPPVVVNAGPDKEILAGTSVILEGTADGTYPVTWAPATGLVVPANDPLHPVASPTVTTTYTLSAGAGGCASSDQVTVTVRPAIRIPNAFTPNGDGRDDTWQIEFIEQFPDNTVTVFNRWGNQIFSATNYSRANEWRGDIKGQPAPVGTYYYVVVTKGPLGKSYAGSLTILY